MTASCRLRRAQRGTGLFDALIALAILSFGLLAMTRFQGRMVAQTSETQARQIATQFAAEHLSTVLVDVVNAPCYTRPQAGTCGNAAAATRTADWAASAAAALPQPAAASAALDTTTNRMTVSISWYGKGSGEQRLLQATTDVR